MTMWVAVVGACASCFALKLAGYLAPHAWLERPRVVRIAGLVTVALLAALVAVQTLANGRHLQLDARVPALGVAVLLWWRRRPFVAVVAAAAVTAAALRALT